MRTLTNFKHDNRGEMQAILVLIFMAMIVYLIWAYLTPTIATASSSAAGNQDNVGFGGGTQNLGGGGIIRLSGGVMWAILGLGIVAVALMKMFGYIG